MSATHVAYGLGICSDVPLPGLPLNADLRGVDVRIRFEDLSAFPLGVSFSSADLIYSSPSLDARGTPNLTVGKFAKDGHIGFFYSDGARFLVDRQGREVHAHWPDSLTLEDACTYLLGPILACVLRLRGITCLHASAVAMQGQAIALFGLAGAGKSTTAAAFALRGYPVLSDDVAALTEQGDRFLVQPGYPRINLWPDSVRALLGSETTLPRITPTWDKRYLALDQNGCRFQPRPFPLGAIYILDERDDSLRMPVIEEVTGGEALMALVANTYVNYLLDSDMRAREFGVLSQVLAKVPVRRVQIPVDPTKAFGLCESIAADVAQLIPSLASSAAHAAD